MLQYIIYKIYRGLNEMGLFRNKDTHKNKSKTNDIIEEVNHCKDEDLETLLQRIESKIKNSDIKDRTLLSAKTMVTSKIALRNSAK